MKIPGLSKSMPKPDRTITYQVVGGFDAQTPTVPSWSPKIGSTVRGDSPLLAYLFSVGGSRYFLPADADSIEVGQAYSAATYGFEATPTPDLSIRTPGPSTDLRICVKAIQVGDSMIAAGSLADGGSPLVARFPGSWQKAPEGYGE